MGVESFSTAVFFSSDGRNCTAAEIRQTQGGRGRKRNGEREERERERERLTRTHKSATPSLKIPLAGEMKRSCVCEGEWVCMKCIDGHACATAVGRMYGYGAQRERRRGQQKRDKRGAQDAKGGSASHVLCA